MTLPVKSSIRPSSPGEARISPNRENDTTNLWSENQNQKSKSISKNKNNKTEIAFSSIGCVAAKKSQFNPNL